MTEKQEEYIIRSVKSVEEMKMIVQWAVLEGWPIGKHDADCYLETFKEGCKVIVHKDKQEDPLGAILLSDYSDKEESKVIALKEEQKDPQQEEQEDLQGAIPFTFIGLFIVRKDRRREGLGTMLWEQSMKITENRLSVGLFAVPQQISRYKRAGFKTAGEILRWETQGPFTSVQDDSALPLKVSDTELDKELIQDVARYDCNFFPKSRFNLIKRMLEKDDAFGFALRDQEGKREIIGYGMIRSCCIKGCYRFGPLYANNFESAKVLGEKLLGILSGKEEVTVVFDTPSGSHNYSFCEYLQLKKNPTANTSLMIKNQASSASANTYSMFKNQASEEHNVLEKLMRNMYSVCSLEVS
jgi:[ribosomal protein S18]-alanine N-acetyltransferase